MIPLIAVTIPDAIETIPTLNRPVEVSPLRVMLVPVIESLNLEVP